MNTCIGTSIYWSTYVGAYISVFLDNGWGSYGYLGQTFVVIANARIDYDEYSHIGN